MQNMKSYFSSWKPFWKSSKNSCHTQTLTLAPSNINFTNLSLGDLKNSIIDEKLMIDISTKLMASISPPKLQICAHHNQWFALNNSHLLVYRQLERIGVCHTVVCDIIRSQDIPIGIRQTLTPTVIPQQEQQGSNGDHYMLINDEKPENEDEVIYCSDVQADSCGCLEDEEQFDDSLATGGDSDSDDEEIEWQTNSSFSTTQISTISNKQFDEIDFDDNEIEDNQKEMQSLL